MSAVSRAYIYLLLRRGGKSYTFHNDHSGPIKLQFHESFSFSVNFNFQNKQLNQVSFEAISAKSSAAALHVADELALLTACGARETMRPTPFPRKRCAAASPLQ